MQNKKAAIKKSVIFSFIALFIYGVWWLFSPLASEYLRMKTTKAMTGRVYHLKDVYRARIEKITYVNGYFIMFMTKPKLFTTLQRYIYISVDGINWQEVYRPNINVEKYSGVHSSDGFPIKFNNKCFMYSNYLGSQISANCQTKWQYTSSIWPKNMWKVTMKGSENNYTQPLKYKNKLVYVFKKDQGFFTSQLIVGHEILYSTDDGINWSKLDVSESVINGLVVQNGLEIAKLIEEINYKGTAPIAYNLPQFPSYNLEAYRVLSEINSSMFLKLNLSKRLTAYGNETYIGLVTMKNKDDYHFFISKDGKSYQLIKVPFNITNFFVDIFFN